MTSPETCPAPRHGTATAYRANGCRCPEAKRAQWLAQKRYRLRLHREGEALLIDAAGTVRRIQALRRLGWPLTALAARLGVSKQRVQQFGTQAQGRVHRDLAARVARLYDELSMTPGPGDVRVIRRAEAMGWPPPLAWDDDEIDDPRARPYSARKERLTVDEIAVTEAMSGRAVHLTKAEKREVAVRLSRLGLSASEVADRMGTNREAAAKLVTRGKAAA